MCRLGNCYPCSEDKHCSSGYVCINRLCQLSPSCGNGRLDRSEQCDDGNTTAGDGCSPTCLLEAGNICGNSIVERPFEQCDDGNTLNGDGCTSRCRFEPNFVAGLSVCGDGVVAEAEECDDGNVRDFDGCNRVCLYESGRCGDGVIQSALNEQCEPSTHDRSLPYSCNKSCRFVSAACGNGIVNPGEECDEGNLNSNRPNMSCRADCSLSKCGDGIVDPLQQEVCDDGNTIDGDGCSSTCLISYHSAIHFPGQVLSLTNESSTAVPSNRLPIIRMNRQNSPDIAGETGPITVSLIAMGAAAGVSYTRRRRRDM